MPLMVVVLFAAVYVLVLFHKRCIKRRREKLHSHAPDLLGSAMLLFYFLYLFVTRTTLDIFNCNPTTPPDGNLVRGPRAPGPLACAWPRVPLPCCCDSLSRPVPCAVPGGGV